MFIVYISMVCLGAKQAIGFHCDDGFEVSRRHKDVVGKLSCIVIYNWRLIYVRNAPGLVRDRAKLLHILVILFLVIYISNRNILQIIIQYSSKGNGSKEHYTRNICMKAATPVLSDKFLLTLYVNGFLHDLVMTLCYFIALKTR